MVRGYVEELALRYFMKKGYLVTQNIWFQIPKEESGKKVAGWSDIDLLAINEREVLVVQCKSFLGTGAAEKVYRNVSEWFGYAENFIRNDDRYSRWLNGKSLEKILVVDWGVRKTEEMLREEGITIIKYDTMLRELLSILKREMDGRGAGRIGKEEDPIMRLLVSMIQKGMIREDVF